MWLAFWNTSYISEQNVKFRYFVCDQYLRTNAVLFLSYDIWDNLDISSTVIESDWLRC